MGEPEDPPFHLISTLPLVSAYVDGWLQDVAKMEAFFAQAAAERIDELTVARTLRVYGNAMDELPQYEEDLRLCSTSTLTTTQLQVVERLQADLARIRSGILFVLTRAEELRTDGVEVLLRKSDCELGVEQLAECVGGDRKPAED